MKTTSIGAKMARLQMGVGSMIANLAAARGLDKAVVEAAFAPKHGRNRTPGPIRPTGAKLRHGAYMGELTVRHVSATDQYWRDVYAKRVLAARDKRLRNAELRQSGVRKFAFQQ